MIQPVCSNLPSKINTYIEKNPEKVLLATVGVMAAAFFASMAAVVLSPAFTGIHAAILVTSVMLPSLAFMLHVIAKDLWRERPPSETRYTPINDPIWHTTWKYNEYPPYYNWEWGWRQRPYPYGEF